MIPGTASNTLREHLVAVLKNIYDPEIPVNIYDIGLIYRLEVDDEGRVEIEMTLTSPACPVAGTLPAEVEGTICAQDGVREVKFALTWDPPWTPERMSEAAQLELGFY